MAILRMKDNWIWLTIYTFFIKVIRPKTYTNALVVRYELKFLFHKEILDPIKDFPQLSPFTSLLVSCNWWCFENKNARTYTKNCYCGFSYIRSARLRQSQVLSSSHHPNQLLFAVFMWGCQWFLFYIKRTEVAWREGNTDPVTCLLHFNEHTQ